MILKGLARAQTQLYKSLIEEEGSSTMFIPQSFHSFMCSEDLENAALEQQSSLEQRAALCGTLVRWLCCFHQQYSLSVVPEQFRLLQGTLTCLR